MISQCPTSQVPSVESRTTTRVEHMDYAARLLAGADRFDLENTQQWTSDLDIDRFRTGPKSLNFNRAIELAEQYLPSLQLVSEVKDAPEANKAAENRTGGTPFITGIADFKKAFHSLYPKLDRDKQGGISLAALDKAMQDPKLTGSDAQILAALKQYFKEFSNLGSNGGVHVFTTRTITKDAITKFANVIDDFQHGRKIDPKLSDLYTDVRSMIVLAPSAIKAQTDALYANEKEPLRSIVPDAVKQPFGVGDCYFEAALASLASINPQMIKNMIKENKDGSFTVTFPGAPKEPITVQRPTQAEVAFYGGESKCGAWPWVLRKAYGKYCNQHFWRRDITNLSGPRTDVEGLDGGSSYDAGIRMLTGHGVSKLYAKSAKFDVVQQELDKAINSGDPEKRVIVTASTRSLGPKHTADNFTAGHDYSVIAFKPNKSNPAEAQITLRDPVASDGGGTGTRTISLQKFKANFYTLDLEKKK